MRRGFREIRNSRTRSKSHLLLVGLILADGPLWAHQRRYMLRYMRDFGFGTRSVKLESLVEQEMQDVIEVLHGRKKDEGIFKDGQALVPDLFYHVLLNAIWSMYAGDRFSHSDHRFTRFIAQQGIDFIRATGPTGGALVLTPWLRYILPEKSGFSEIRKTNQQLVEIIRVSNCNLRICPNLLFILTHY